MAVREAAGRDARPVRAGRPRSTKAAKSAAAKRTANHDVGGWPATVKATKTRGDDAGLREKLAFLYQDKPRSRFSKLVRK